MEGWAVDDARWWEDWIRPSRKVSHPRRRRDLIDEEGKGMLLGCEYGLVDGGG